MLGFAVRITLPYASGVDRIVRAWSLYAKKIVAYEHNDDGANNVHCHLHVEDFTTSVKRFQQLAQETGVPLTVKKDGKVRATSLMSIRGADYDKHISGYAYLTKGKYEPSYLQGFTQEETQIWKSTWIPRAKHIKRTVWHQLQDKFLSESNFKLPTVTLSDEAQVQVWEGKMPHPFFTLIETAARKYVWGLSDGQWLPQQKNQIESIVRTYCNKNKISIPKGWKVNN